MTIHGLHCINLMLIQLQVTQSNHLLFKMQGHLASVLVRQDFRQNLLNPCLQVMGIFHVHLPSLVAILATYGHKKQLPCRSTG